MPLVATVLGYHVDGTALETAVTDIERCKVNGNLVDSVQRDGAAACWQVGADAESVVERSTVNCHRRTTIVAAAGCKAATSDRGLRGQLHNVVHAAAGRGNILNHTVVNQSIGTRILNIHVVLDTFGNHRHRFQRGGRNLQYAVDHNRSAQRCVHVGNYIGLVAHHFHFDGVRSASNNIVDAVNAIAAGESMIGDSCGGVDSRNHRILETSIGIGNMTGNGSSCRLGICRCCKQHADEDNKQSFKSLTHNFDFLDYYWIN